MTLGEFETAFVHDGNDDCLLYSEVALLKKNDKSRVGVNKKAIFSSPRLVSINKSYCKDADALEAVPNQSFSANEKEDASERKRVSIDVARETTKMTKTIS